MANNAPESFRERVAALIAAGEVAPPLPAAAGGDAFAEMARFAFEVVAALRLGGGKGDRLRSLDKFTAERRDFFKGKLPAPANDLATNVWRLMVKNQRTAFEKQRAAAPPQPSSSSSSAAPTGMKRMREREEKEEEDESTVEYYAGPDREDINFLQDVLVLDTLNEVIARVDTPGALVRLELVSQAIARVAETHWSDVVRRIAAALNYFQDVVADAYLPPPLISLRDAVRARPNSLPDARELAMGVLRAVAGRMTNDFLVYFFRGVVYQWSEHRKRRAWLLYVGGDAPPEDADDDLLNLTLTDQATQPLLEVPPNSRLRQRPSLMAHVDKINEQVMRKWFHMNAGLNGRRRLLPPLMDSDEIVVEQTLTAFFLAMLMDVSVTVKTYYGTTEVGDAWDTSYGTTTGLSPQHGVSWNRHV